MIDNVFAANSSNLDSANLDGNLGATDSFFPELKLNNFSAVGGSQDAVDDIDALAGSIGETSIEPESLLIQGNETLVFATDIGKTLADTSSVDPLTGIEPLSTSMSQAIALGKVVDFNGDGKTDFIRQEKGVWDDDDIDTAQVYLSNGDGTFAKQDLTDWQVMKGDQTNLIVGDYNGDGKSDFIRQEKGIWDDDDIDTAQVYLSNGDGTFAKQELTDWQQMKGDLTNLIVGDYNGDGKTDFIRQEKRYWDDDDIDTAKVYLANGDGTFAKQDLTDWQQMKGDQTNLIVGDYNGDGKSDFIRQEKGAWDNDEGNTANVYLSNGDGTFAKQDLTDWQQMKGDLTNLIVGDYNGDGKSDFIRQEKGGWDDDEGNTANVYLSNGDGTFAKQDLTDWQVMKGDLTNLIVGDYNGDGKSDFIRQDKGAWDNNDYTTAEIYLSEGDGTFAKQRLTDWRSMKGDLTDIIAGLPNLIFPPTWQVEYFNNRDLAGAPIFVDTWGDGTENFSFNWQNGSPDGSVPSDNFSARITTQRYLKPGLYHIKTTSDDGIRVQIGSQSVINQWVDQPFVTNSGYFYSEGGEYPIAIEYFERGGTAALNFDLQKADQFIDPANSNEWKATFFNWDNSEGNQPPTDFYTGGLDNRNAIGRVNLGSNTRSDGKQGISFNWGSGTPNNDGERLPHDFFGIRAYTEANLEAGKTYKARVRADDGYQLLAKHQGTDEWVYFTPENEWKQDAYGAHQEIEFEVTQTGTYDFHFHLYEAGVDTYFDLSWEEVGASYLDELTSWTEEQWNWAAGDNTRITGPMFFGETDEREDPDHPGHEEILQIYNDMVTQILGTTYPSSAGYVQDSSYLGEGFGYHTGIDIDTPNMDESDSPTSVRALVGGTARVVQWEAGNQFLEIAGDDGRFYRYGHLSSLNVTSGQVNAGDVIGQLGMSLASNHLQFQVNKISVEDRRDDYNPFNQSHVYEWTLNPLKVFWQLKQEGSV